METAGVKKGWSWLGFFFGPYYYAGYGMFKKGLILGFLSSIPLIGTLGVPIYCGIKAKKELLVGETPFDWKSSFGLFGVFSVIFFIFVTIAIIVEIEKEDTNATEASQIAMTANAQPEPIANAQPAQIAKNEFAIQSIKIGQPLGQFDGILKCKPIESPFIVSKSGKTVVTHCGVEESKPVHWNDFIGQPLAIYVNSDGNVCGFVISFDVRLSSKDLAYMSKDIFGEELSYKTTHDLEGRELDVFQQTIDNGQMEERKKLVQTDKAILAMYLYFDKTESVRWNNITVVDIMAPTLQSYISSILK